MVTSVRSSRIGFGILAGIVLLACAGKAVGRQNPPPGIEVVALPVTVTEGDGGPVIDLSREDFTILEDGEPVEVLRFEGPELPINLAIVVDPSPKTDSKIEWTREEVKAFLGMLDGGGLATVVAAQAEPRSLSALTTDRGGLEAAVDSLVSDGRPTNRLFDTTIGALVTLLEAGSPRSGVVVLTDGIDVGSDRRQADFERTVQFAGIPVYVIAVDNVEGYSGNLGNNVAGVPAGNRVRGALANLAEGMERIYYGRQDWWRGVAERTGGGFFAADDEDAVRAIFPQLLNRLRSTYTFYYYSDGKSGASDLTPIEVRVNRLGVEVHAPEGIWLLEDAEEN